MQAEYKRRLLKRNGDGTAPVPLNKGGGDSPSSGLAETITSTRKKKKLHSVNV